MTWHLAIMVYMALYMIMASEVVHISVRHLDDSDCEMPSARTAMTSHDSTDDVDEEEGMTTTTITVMARSSTMVKTMSSPCPCRRRLSLAVTVARRPRPFISRPAGGPVRAHGDPEGIVERNKRACLGAGTLLPASSSLCRA